PSLGAPAPRAPRARGARDLAVRHVRRTGGWSAVKEDLDVHLVAIRSGDARAFGAWLSAAEPSLRGGLRSFARQVDVEAVLQEALLRTWQVAPRFEADGQPNGLVRLAQRIARNLAVSE